MAPPLRSGPAGQSIDGGLGADIRERTKSRREADRPVTGFGRPALKGDSWEVPEDRRK